MRRGCRLLYLFVLMAVGSVKEAGPTQNLSLVLEVIVVVVAAALVIAVI